MIIKYDYKKKKKFISKILSFRVFVVAGILIIIFLGSALGKEMYREYQIRKEIDSLKSDIEALEKNNYKLSQLVEYYETDEYREAEARKKLNLKKEGENVVIIKPSPLSIERDDFEEKADQDNNLPNYKKWWNYFFETGKD
jgi:cell division protein FtsB